jgi:hypothetical protein
LVPGWPLAWLEEPLDRRVLLLVLVPLGLPLPVLRRQELWRQWS